MSFHGFDPGDRNNWYQSPQLGLFPTSPTGYSGGYYCLPSSHLHVTQFPSQPSYRPLPSQFPFQMSCSPPPPPPSHTIINGFVFPHQFPSTHTHHSPDSNPNPWIYPSISQSHSYDPSITSVNSHFVSTKTMPTSSVYHSAPLIPTFQSPSVSSIVPQHQFTVPEPLPLHSKPFRGCRCRVVMGAKARVSKKTRNPDLLHDVGKYSRSKRYPKRGLWVIKAKNGNIFPRHNAKATVAIMEEFHQLLVGQTTPITEPAWSPLTFGSLPAGSVALTAANGSSSMLSVSSRGIRISEKPNFNLSPHEVILGLNKNFITGIHREQTTTTVVTEELVLNVDKNIARGIHGVKFSDIPDGEDDNEDKDDEGGNECVIFGSSAASKELQQDIIDGKFNSESFDTFKDGCPQIHGQFEWSDVIRSVKNLYEVSKTVKERRFSDGALQLDNSKVVILFDEYGDPYDSLFSERKESNSLVEEFMLLANRTAAEVISRAFPNSALLRRHPEPNMRKLKEFEAFCSKHGLEMDTSSSGRFHQSPERIREKLKDDSVLFNILMNYATKPMQLATYFCSGELKHKENDWGHYGLAVPLYTHFTSPLRRYPDIVVHRTLAAAIEAEELYLEHQRLLNNLNRGDKFKMRCFTGVHFDKDAAESRESQEALLAAAMKHRVPNTELLTDVAAHCNVRKLASRHVKDACDKLHIWSLLKKKEILLSEARVMGLGPRFMSIYIQKLAVERRINYDEVEGLMVEWLDATSTLVLSLGTDRLTFRRGSPGKWRALEDAALIVSPYDLQAEPSPAGKSSNEPSSNGCSLNSEVEPMVFPLTVRLLSTIHVVLHAVGGDDGPVDIGARLYMSSYLC